MITITTEQAASLDILVREGYAITNFYTDGAIRCQQHNPDLSHSDAMYLFVRQDGTCTPPTLDRITAERLRLDQMGLVLQRY